MTTTHRRLALALVAVLVPAAAAAAPPSQKVLPQNAVTHCSTANPCRQPTVDGVVEPLEYADGHVFQLQDYGAGGANGKLFVMVTDDPDYPTGTCSAGGGACRTQNLYLGLTVPRPDDGSGNFVDGGGQVTVWLDSKRADTLALVSGAGAPRSEDRRLVLAYDTSTGTVSLTQTRGNGAGWTTIPSIFSFWGASKEVTIPAGDPSRIHIELSVTLRPALASASEPLDADLLGLGLRHTRVASASVPPMGGAGTLPNDTLFPPTDLATASWETLDLSNPTPIPMSFTTWNVGQIPIAEDGGSATLDDIAAIVATKDTVCLAEMWSAGDRDELVEKVNHLRALQNQPPMEAVYEGDDDVFTVGGYTGLMIMTSHHIILGGIHHFPENLCFPQLPIIGECDQDKGVAWARVSLPTAEPPPVPPGSSSQPRPKGFDGSEFMDVFCSHLQAEDNGPGPATDVRNAQIADAEAFMRRARSGGPLVSTPGEDDLLPVGTWASGLDRPAILLGDLNTPGPHGFLPNGDPDMPAGFSDPQFWQTMLTLLGNDVLTPFEATNSLYFDGHDLGLTVTGPDPKASGTGLDVCGPDVASRLDEFPRIDYGLILPADTGDDLPAFAISASPAPAASVDPHFIAGECLSDHAQLDLNLSLVRITDKLRFNAAKRHRAQYEVARIKTGGSCCVDWFTPRIAMFGPTVGSQQKAFLNDELWEGNDVTPHWFVRTGTATLSNLPAGFTSRVSATVTILDSEDSSNTHYDVVPEGGNGQTNDDLDQHVSFFGSTGELHRVRGGGSLLNVSVELIGNFNVTATDQLCVSPGPGQSLEANAVMTGCFRLTELDN